MLDFENFYLVLWTSDWTMGGVVTHIFEVVGSKLLQSITDA